MEPKQIKELINKYSQGIASVDEVTLLQNWYRTIGYQDAVYPDDEQEVQGRIFARLQKDIHPVHQVRLWPRIWGIAAVVALVVMGIYFYAIRYPYSGQNSMAYTKDIAPGKNKATLTLANGKKIILSEALDGEVAEETGVTITKTKQGQLIYSIGNTQHKSGDINKINTLSTARGETYQVQLPDGSNVWLNAVSVLKYPANFAALKERRVELMGEAYFEVAKDKRHPFVVVSDQQQVVVLGTHFNINTYADEGSVKTTLLEGAVKVNSQELKPGQQASLKGYGISVANVDVEEAVAWKTGKFMFTDLKLGTIMKMVSRWYDVDVSYTNNEIINQPFSGSVSRFEDISQLIQVLETTNLVKFKISGRNIIISPIN